MKRVAIFCALSLLIGGVALVSSPVGAAEWISGADSYAAAWVRDIEQELNKKEYRMVFLNDPRAPQASVLRLLNRAAMAYNAKDTALAEDLVRQALQVLQEGIRKNYFSQEDVQPITSFIKAHVPVKVE